MDINTVSDVIYLSLLSRGCVLQLCVIACVHQAAADPAKLALPGYGEQRPVKVGMVLPKVFFLPVPSHLGLLMLGLNQLDVQVLGPVKKSHFRQKNFSVICESCPESYSRKIPPHG
jgi:hypothetical protein